MSFSPSGTAETRELLEKYGFYTKKGLGQNFLTDPAVLSGIAEAAELSENDTVLEIGPGAGSLTRVLAERAGRVLAIELDERLKPLLGEALSDFDNISIHWGDVLKTDIAELLEREGIVPPVKVVANLPYYITTPVLLALLARKELFSSLTLMVQEEVGERMAAQPGGKDYGFLSVSVQYYAMPEIALKVPPHAFLPQPKVSSVVVLLKPLEKPPVALRGGEDYFFSVVKAAFLQRRKTLANALSAYPPVKTGRESVYRALDEMHLDRQIRGEKLSLTQFAQLAERLRDINKV